MTTITEEATEAVRVKPLEWRYYPDAFPPAWDAQTSIGRYSIVQESVEADATGEPIDPTDIWVVTLDGRTIGSNFDLDAAKTLAFADCEKREALPMSIYRVEEDEDTVRLSIGGTRITAWSIYTDEGLALLKLDAAIRDIKGAGDV